MCNQCCHVLVAPYVAFASQPLNKHCTRDVVRLGTRKFSVIGGHILSRPQSSMTGVSWRSALLSALERLAKCQQFNPRQGPVSLTIFHQNLNSIEIIFCFPVSFNDLLITKMCTWHDSWAAVACAKICSDIINENGITLRPIFQRIWLTTGKMSMKWAHALRYRGNHFTTNFFHSRPN